MNAPKSSILAPGRRLLIVAAVAIVYFLAAEFGLSLAILSRQVSPLWPPTGIALTSLLLLGRWVWPGIAIGAFAINALVGSMPAAFGIAVGNTLEAVVGATLLHRYGFRCSLERRRDVIALTVCSAILSTTVSATLGVLSLSFSGAATWSDFGTLWWTWWLGDAIGSLVVSPLLLIGATSLREPRMQKRPVESAIFVSVVAIMSYLVLGGGAGSPQELKYLIFPFFVWSALRLGQLPTALGIALAASFVVHWFYSVSNVINPQILNAKLLLMQSFLGILSVGSLILGAVVAERERISAERDALLESEQAARADAERIARQKDDFVATLSHELRTPLNGLLGWTQVLRRAPQTGVNEEGLAAVERCGRALTHLLDDLMDMTRMTTGKMKLRMAPVDLAKVIDDCVEMTRPDAASKEVELKKHIQVRLVVLGDAARLQQALCNLISNAVKFSPAAGRIDITLVKQQDQAVVRIADQGLGIDPGVLPYIFDRFRQADSSTTRRFGGLGLGLAIVKHIVQLHGGTVSAQSPGPGFGSTFSLQLPLPAERLNSQPSPAAIPSQLDDVQIMIVDDDPDACELLRRILTEMGARVITANSADQAQANLTDAIDVLLSDIGLPDKDGYQLIREVRQSQNPAICEIAAIAVTAFTRPEDRQKALQAGYDAVVGKPIDISELLNQIAKTLHSRTSSRA